MKLPADYFVLADICARKIEDKSVQRLLNKVQTVQVSDTTGDDSSNAA